MNNTSHRIAVSKILLHNLACVWIINPGNETKKNWVAFAPVILLQHSPHTLMACLRDTVPTLQKDIQYVSCTFALPVCVTTNGHSNKISLSYMSRNLYLMISWTPATIQPFTWSIHRAETVPWAVSTTSHPIPSPLCDQQQHQKYK